MFFKHLDGRFDQQPAGSLTLRSDLLPVMIAAFARFVDLLHVLVPVCDIARPFAASLSPTYPTGKEDQ